MREGPLLRPCPDSPNCVSSQSQSPEQYVEPFSFSGTVTGAKAKLHSFFESQPRTHIVVDQDTYLHVEITSYLFGFIDDVEFAFDNEQKLIHVRSASRTGYWDFGVNRKRIEVIRTKFFKQS